MACSAHFLISTQDLLPSRGNTHSELVPSTAIINQEKAPTDLPVGKLIETFSQLWFLFPDNSNLHQAAKNQDNQPPF